MAGQQSGSKRHLRSRKSCRWLMVLLCLATWRGPIPCVHAHAGHADHQTRLGHHLETYHSRGQFACTRSWHFHFLLPWQKFECYDCQDDPEPPLDPLTHEGALVLGSDADGILSALSCERSSATHVGIFERPRCVAILSACHGNARCFSSFVESLLLSSPLCTVTGVALC
jgi:hypothetical protein